jgi:hypothetical protein
MTLLLALLLMAPGDWTARDTQIQAGIVALSVVDLSLTCYGLTHHQTGFKELNPIMGRHPSSAKVWTLGAVGMAGHTLVAWLLPRGWRERWQLAGLVVEGMLVINNTIIVSGGF